MASPASYLPGEIFAPSATERPAPPRVFIAPQRYVQGPGVRHAIGRLLSLVGRGRVGVLLTARGQREEGAALTASLRAAGRDAVVSRFRGECSLEEIAARTEELGAGQVASLVAVGGGKCLDTGKAIAYRLGIPMVAVPSLASNDAPCSALSVLYSPEGAFTGAEFYPDSPALVVVDTEVIAAAPERFLVAGMGDAMATWYEADVCLRNPHGVTTIGARPTLAACAIAETCADTLFRDGVAAAAAVARHAVDDALEAVVEANTLLSGLGFESGGLAAAHAVAQSCTAIPGVEAEYLHGEMVALGTLVQLVLEGRRKEAGRVAGFFAEVGLPVHLAQLGLGPGDSPALDVIAQGAAAFPFIGNMPGDATPGAILAALLETHALGLAVSAGVGDSAYRRLHPA